MECVNSQAGGLKCYRGCNKVDPTSLDCNTKTQISVNCETFIMFCLHISPGVKTIDKEIKI